MRDTNLRLVVLPIEPMLLDTAYPPDVPLPLHCTVMPWFPLRGNLDSHGLGSRLATLARTAMVHELVLEKFGTFGPGADIPAHVLSRDGALLRFHTELLCFLARSGSDPGDIDWIGAGYTPHVSDRKRRFSAGQIWSVQRLALLERRQGGVRVVVGEYELGDTSF
jgi:hypothetical protein